MWQGVPRLLDLSFTHILQLSFMKQRERPSATVDWFTNTSMVIGFSGLPKKMWVRIRAKSQGLLQSSHKGSLWDTSCPVLFLDVVSVEDVSSCIVIPI